jgi:hypothetical protein
MAKKKKIKRQKPFLALPENSSQKSLVGRPRVSVLCKAYNISDDTLIDFLHSKGYRDLNLSSLLDENAIKLIQNQFQSDKFAKDKIRGNTTIQFTNPKPSIPIQKTATVNNENASGKIYREPILHLTSNLFNKQKVQVALKGYQTIASSFHDNEAINICSKMSSSFTRHLCKQLHNPKSNRQLILYKIHHIANKALGIFGGKILTFIHELRNLDFKNQTASEIQTYKKVIPDFPILSFETSNTAFKISFFVKQTNKDGKLKSDIRLFAPKTYEEIGAIDEEGYVMARLERFKPQLTLFYQATKDNKFKIYSGVETGNCDICGRELSHPISLRIGIGPICARNKQVDETLYNFT